MGQTLSIGDGLHMRAETRGLGTLGCIMVRLSRGVLQSNLMYILNADSRYRCVSEVNDVLRCNAGAGGQVWAGLSQFINRRNEAEKE